MMTLEQLEQKHKELGEEIARLKAAQDDVWPKIGGEYWAVDLGGGVIKVNWDGDEYDVGAIAMDNIFRNEAQAQKEREARKVIAEIRRQPGARGFIGGENNYGINGLVCSGLWRVWAGSFANTYFNTEAQTHAAIKSVGRDRILAAVQWWNVESWEK